MFVPFPLIGVDEPMFVFGAIASTSAACAIQTPADAARAPAGRDVDDHRDLQATSSWLTILRIDSSSPPGVSSTITAAA